MMPGLLDSLGGAYSFGRPFGGSQPAYKRNMIGGANGAENTALIARQFLGAQ